MRGTSYKRRHAADEGSHAADCWNREAGDGLPGKVGTDWGEKKRKKRRKGAAARGGEKEKTGQHMHWVFSGQHMHWRRFWGQHMHWRGRGAAARWRKKTGSSWEVFFWRKKFGDKRENRAPNRPFFNLSSSLFVFHLRVLSFLHSMLVFLTSFLSSLMDI